MKEERGELNPYKASVPDGLHEMQPIFNGTEIKKPITFSPVERVLIQMDAVNAVIKKAGK